MNNTSQNELSLTLTEVRKAYRLLYFYQRRVLDTVKYLVDSLGIKVHSGWSLFSDNAPKNGKNINLDSWAWDWLNMYMYEFYCGTRQIENDSYQFAVQVQSDTGFYDNLVGKTDVANFAKVEEASTRLLFVVGKNRWKNDDGNNASYSHFKTIPALKAGGYPIFFEASENNHEVLLVKSYPLESFIDESHIHNNIDDFKNLLLEKGLPDIFKN